MNGPSGQPPDDEREFVQFLERGDSLSRAYTALGAEAPDPRLDEWIRTKARRAVRRTSADSPARNRWVYPVGLAATLVLTVSLVLRLREEAPVAVQAPAPAKRESAEAPVVSVDILPASPRPDRVAEALPEPGAAVSRNRSAPRSAGREKPAARAKEPAPRPTLAAETFAAQATRGPVNPRNPAGVADELAPILGPIRARLEAAGPAPGEPAAPERALREILRLYDAGDAAGARAALARFRQAYPDDPVSRPAR